MGAQALFGGIFTTFWQKKVLQKILEKFSKIKKNKLKFNSAPLHSTQVLVLVWFWFWYFSSMGHLQWENGRKHRKKERIIILTNPSIIYIYIET